MRTIRIKNTSRAAEQLYRASIPSCVIEDILGKTFEVEENTNSFHVPSSAFVGKPVEWQVPTECVELVTKE